jgi:hypothetical protein
MMEKMTTMLTLTELKLLDVLKIEPDSSKIFKMLCPPFPEDEIDVAFKSLSQKGLIEEELKRTMSQRDGRWQENYIGRIGYWKVVMK